MADPKAGGGAGGLRVLKKRVETAGMPALRIFGPAAIKARQPHASPVEVNRRLRRHEEGIDMGTVIVRVWTELIVALMPVSPISRRRQVDSAEMAVTVE